MAGDGKMSADIGKKAGGKPARRGFLVGAGAAAGAAGAGALTLGKGPQAVTTEVAGAAAPEPVRGKGYHVTDHIRKYYETAKV